MHPLNSLLARVETSQLWAYFHKDWLLQIRSQIRPQLPKAYSIFVESEAILVAPASGTPSTAMAPDLAIARPESHSAQPSAAAQATAAVLEVEEPCELVNSYTLLIRRAPENRLVAVVEMLSPSNKGVFGIWDKDKFLSKRYQYLGSGVNLLEIDALLAGERILPPSLASLSKFSRTTWTAFHEDGRRHLQGWGWNDSDPPPVMNWTVERGVKVLVDLPQTIEGAAQFNPWESLVS